MSPQQLKEVLSGGAYTSKAEGTGLGLAITRQIAARYGGLLRINSREGKGTAVEVLFPRRRGSSDEGAHTGG
jgi:signal transduction histidine kinase